MPNVKIVQCPVGPFNTRCLLAGDEAASPVVLLHDGAWGGAGSVTWGSVIPKLAARYRVIVPDMLGFGGTDKVVFLDRSPYAFRADHIVALLDQLGVTTKVHLVGNSFGGSVALRMIETCSSRVASVVSINGTGGPWRTEFGRKELGRWDGTRADLGRILDIVMDRTPHFDFEAHLNDRMQAAIAYGHYRSMSAPALPQPPALGQPSGDTWPAGLAGSDVRVLMIGGLRDPLVETCWIDMLSAHLKRPKTIWMDTKHCPNIDDPATTADILIDWLG